MRVTPVFLMLLMGSLGCTIADEDRCIDGYTWNPHTRGCYEDTNQAVDTSGDTQGLADAGAGDAGGSDGMSEPSGFKESCFTQEDCASYEANYCLKNPTTTDPGMCTVQDCAVGTCPDNAKCCDCTTITLPVLCIPEEALADSILSSMCENCG